MAVLDLTEPVSRIRLSCGDTSDLAYLDDTTYQYCLDSNEGNEPAATKMAAQFILAQLSYGSHNRLGAIEQWGSETFNNYLAYIKQVITNPAYNPIGSIYVGGIDVADASSNKADPSVVQQNLPIFPYIGDDETTLY